jgi:hypothetical protein
MEIGFKKIVCNLLGITARSYSNWSKEKRPIISFFEKNYLTKNDLEEYINTGKVEKLELIRNFSTEELRNRLVPNNEPSYTTIENLKFKFINLPLSSKGAAIMSIFIFVISNLQDTTKESFLKNIHEIRQSFLDSLIFTFLTNPQKGDIKRYLMTDTVKNEAKELIQDFFSEKEIEFIFKNKSIVVDFLKKLSQKYIV